MSYFNKFVNSGSTTHAGLASVQRALSSGMSIEQIRNASRNQGFIFADKASKFMNQQELQQTANQTNSIQENYQRQFANLQEKMNQQQQSYNNRLSAMNNTLRESQAQTQSALMAANQSGTKETVLGVKSATSKDSPDIKKLTRAGMKGSFNRQGLRIKGLNGG